MRNFSDAFDNGVDLRFNQCPGEIISIGYTPDGTHAVIIHAIVGPNVDSQNRLVYQSDNTLKVESLTGALSYTSMTQKGDVHIVGNGEHVTKSLSLSDLSFWGLDIEALSLEYGYKADAYVTSRIIGMYIKNGPFSRVQFLLLEKHPFNNSCLTKRYEYLEILPGLSYTVHTYEGGSKALTTCYRDPYMLRIYQNTAEGIADDFYTLLAKKYFVGLAVKYINLQTGTVQVIVRNRNEELKK